MTVVADRPAGVASAPASRSRAARNRRFHSGQLVATELAAVALIAGFALGVVALIAALPIAAALLIMAWTRLRGRWLFQWLRVWLSFRTRRRTLSPGADAAALLGLVRPGARIEEADLDGTPAAMIAAPEGLTALLDVTDSSILPPQTAQWLPSPVTLLPAPAPDTPRFRVQLVAASSPVSGSAPASAAYRQLTDGRIAASERVLLAVHVPAEEGWPESDLRRALSGAVRKVKRKLGDAPCTVLGADALARTLAELAHHDGAHPARESWGGCQVGGLPQVTFRIRRWPDLRQDSSRELLAKLLTLPARAVTVGLAAGPWGDGDTTVRVDLVCRITAADAPTLAAATTALHRLLAGERAAARRLDGEHLEGLAASLPLGGSTPAMLPTEVEHGTTRPAAHVGGLRLSVGNTGLMVGPNRRHEPVLVRFFRPAATRAMLVGGVASAQLIALRSIGLGARVVVQTARPQSWERFLRQLGGPSDSLAMAAPNQPLAVPAATPLRPLLLIVDVGAVGADRSPGHPWQTTLVLRDELAPVDMDALGHVDLALVQPTSAQGAAIAVSVLGLSESQRDALSRPVPGLIGVVNRRSVRWASLSTAPMEQQLLT